MSDDREWHDELAAARAVPGRLAKATNPFACETPSQSVPCIACKRPTPISGFAWEFAKQASEILLRRGEKVLRIDELTRCGPCADAWHEEHSARYGRVVERTNQAQREANETGRVDAALCDWLRINGHAAWADGIESGAKIWSEKQTKTRPGSGRKGDK